MSRVNAFAAAVVLLCITTAPALGADDSTVRAMGTAFGKCVIAIAALVYLVGKLR